MICQKEMPSVIGSNHLSENLKLLLINFSMNMIPINLTQPIKYLMNAKINKMGKNCTLSVL